MNRAAGARLWSWWRPISTLVVLVAAVGLLWVAGRVLPTPPVDSWTEAQRWYERLGPAAAAMSVLRLAGMALAGWLTLSVALQVLTVLPRAARLRWLADLIAPRSLQRLVQGLAGLSLSAGLALPAPSAGYLDTPHAGVAVLRPVGSPSSGSPSSGTATLRLVDQGGPVAPPATPVRVPPADVVVEQGDSLWSIARDAIVEAGVADPDDAVVTMYWQRVVEHNRSGLVVPANPDLIYAGQTITLPEPVLPGQLSPVSQPPLHAP